MKDLIKLRAKLGKLVIETRKKYTNSYHASLKDEDSNSYDEMQKLSGMHQGFMIAHSLICEAIKKEEINAMNKKSSSIVKNKK